MKLYGKNTVLERLRSKPESIRKIFIAEGAQGVAPIRKKAKVKAIPVFTVSRSKLQKLGRSQGTQGVFIDVEDFAYTPYDELLEGALSKKRVLIFLDSLNDPQNFGAIIRSCACLGKFSFVIPTHDSVSVTEAVLRVSSGGDNYVFVSKVKNLSQAIKKAKEAGFWITGASVKGGKVLDEIDIPWPTALVMGSEQKGIRDVIRKQLDLEVSIPMYIDTLSFNVAHATAIFSYEIMRQSKNVKKAKS